MSVNADAVSKHSQLLNRVRALLQPSTISMIKVKDGPVTYNGLAVGDAKMKQYQERHEVTIIHIRPATSKFRTA